MSQSKIKVSELFYSLQGEGRFVGVPSVFLRTFGCNFTCSGFGMPPGEKSAERHLIDVEKYVKFDDLPLVKTGCDSYASWDPRFKNFSPLMLVEDIVDRALIMTPNHRWMQDHGGDVHLVITGGEPLLGWQRSYPDLLNHPAMQDLRNITFETNGTQELHDDFAQFLEQWQAEKPRREITFSVSPKLSASGESWEEAVKPRIVRRYECIGHTYLKFVVENLKHFEEVDRAVAEYRAAGFAGDVYVMPVGGVTSVYDENEFNVAEAALGRGYRFSPRLHITLWGNMWSK